MDSTASAKRPHLGAAQHVAGSPVGVQGRLSQGAGRARRAIAEPQGLGFAFGTSGSPACVRSGISGWRDRALYPLAGGRRAARRILVGRSWPTAGPISFWSSTSARGRSYVVGLATTGSKQRGCPLL